MHHKGHAERSCRSASEPVGPFARVLLGLLILLVATGAAEADPQFPKLTGRVVDAANLLSPQDHEALTAELAALEEKSTDQVVVVTLPSLQGYAIEDFGYRLGRAWGIGQKGKDNGVLLIVAPNERKVRIEVGRGLEPQLTDALTRLIIENAILPAFRRGDFPEGIRAGVRDIKDVLLGDAEAVKERAGGGRPAPGTDVMAWVLVAFWLVVLAFVIWAVVQQMQQAPQTVRRQRARSGGGPVVVPTDWGNSGGSWGGGSGGGGWSGGGGDFGGGGSSGSW